MESKTVALGKQKVDSGCESEGGRQSINKRNLTQHCEEQERRGAPPKDQRRTVVAALWVKHNPQRL